MLDLHSDKSGIIVQALLEPFQHIMTSVAHVRDGCVYVRATIAMLRPSNVILRSASILNLPLACRLGKTSTLRKSRNLTDVIYKSTSAGILKVKDYTDAGSAQRPLGIAHRFCTRADNLRSNGSRQRSRETYHPILPGQASTGRLV